MALLSSSTSLLLRNFRVADPLSPFHEQAVDLLIDQDIIREIQPAGSISDEGCEVYEVPDAWVSPGWVDMQAHLCDPGFEYKEQLGALARAAQIGGFTHVVCYPNTNPVVDNSQMVYALTNRAGALPVQLHFTGTISEQGNGKELAEVFDMITAGAVGFTDGIHPVQSSGLLLRALQYTQGLDTLLIRYPQDNSLAGDGQMNEGPQSTSLGMKGIPEMAESIALARDLELLSYAPSRIHFQPITATESLDMLRRAKQHSHRITAGITAAHLAWDDTALSTFDADYKLMPPLRNKEQVKALHKAVQDGTLDVITSGHQAQGIEEKNVQFELAEPGMLGLQTAFSLMYTHLVLPGILSIGQLIDRISINPRRILGLPAASLQAEQPADLTIFQPDAKWTFGTKHMPSRAKNSPLKGVELQGKVLGVYCKGHFRETRI